MSRPNLELARVLIEQRRRDAEAWRRHDTARPSDRTPRFRGAVHLVRFAAAAAHGTALRIGMARRS